MSAQQQFNVLHPGRDLLPWPDFEPSTRTERDCETAYRQYAFAYAAYLAIDHPAGNFTKTPESEKVMLRAERLEKMRAAEEKYKELAQKVEKLAKQRAQKKMRRKAAPPLSAAQIALFANAWPEEFAWIAARFPRQPYVSNNLDFGLTIRPLDLCVPWSYIQHDPPAHAHVLIIDYDNRQGIHVTEVWRHAGLPEPTWIAVTPDSSGKGHLAWALASPVCTTDAARRKPLDYLARIEQGFLAAVQGDIRYAGLVTKNPVSDRWNVIWMNPEPYKLDDLAQAVNIARYTSHKKTAKQPAEIAPVGHGRKVLTFDTVRMWAYSSISQFWSVGFDAWHYAVREQVELVNASFPSPISVGHRKSIAKSIAKWVWTKFTPVTKAALVEATHKPAVQAQRGRLKGAKARDEKMEIAKELKAQGRSNRQIAAQLGVDHKTVGNWLRRADAPATNMDLH